MKYVVKFGGLYSCGRPVAEAGDGMFGLDLSPNQSEAWVTGDRFHAAAHAHAWKGDAREIGFGVPRVVKLKRSK